MRLVRGLRLHLLRWLSWRLVQEREEGVPTATHVVEYKEKETRTKALVGKVAFEFSPENYGPGDRGEWWLLLEPCLEPTPAAGGS